MNCMGKLQGKRWQCRRTGGLFGQAQSLPAAAAMPRTRRALQSCLEEAWRPGRKLRLPHPLPLATLPLKARKRELRSTTLCLPRSNLYKDQ